MKKKLPLFTKLVTTTSLLAMTFLTLSFHSTPLLARSFPQPLNHFYQPLTRNLLNQTWIGLYESMAARLIITSEGWKYYDSPAKAGEAKADNVESSLVAAGSSVTLIEPSSHSKYYKLELSTLNGSGQSEVVFTFLVHKYIDFSGKLHFLLQDESEKPFVLTLDGDARVNNIPH